MNLIKFIFLCCCLLVTASTVQAAPLPDTTIKHRAAASFSINERTRLEARIEDSKGVIEVRCYFKADTDSTYLYAAMPEQSTNNFQCFLPAFGPGVQALEYFFLTVNGSGQVIRSTPYVIPESGTVNTADKQTGAVSSDLLEVYSELGDTEIENTSIIDSRIHLVTTRQANRLYGLRAGVYKDVENIPDSFGVMPGFFGGFLLSPDDNTVEPVKGFAPNLQPLSMEPPPAAATFSGDFTAETITDPVDIDGDNWQGFFYRTDSNYRLYLTASIVQNGSEVSITTTKSGLGHHLAGNINVYGDMLLYDSYDNEDWTTHNGPARYTKVKIYDYIWPFAPGEPVPPLNAIILYRPPLPPGEVQASDGAFQDKVTVSWNFSDGAAYYMIYDCSSDSTDTCQRLATISSNQYDDTRNIAGKSYYRVRACDDLCSDYSNADTGFLAGRNIVPILFLLL